MKQFLVQSIMIASLFQVLSGKHSGIAQGPFVLNKNLLHLPPDHSISWLIPNEDKISSSK